MEDAGTMPPVGCCGGMLQGDDGVVIGIAMAPSKSRGGRDVRQDAVVTGAAMASSTARWSMAGGWRGDGVVHDKFVVVLRWRRQVAAGDPHRRWGNQN